VSTGRRFNITSLKFTRIFTLYCRSHLYMAFEMIFSLSTLLIIKDCTDCNYGALTWSTWLMATTLVFAPLWFNPFSFESEKVQNTLWSEGSKGHLCCCRVHVRYYGSFDRLYLRSKQIVNMWDL